MVPVPVWVAPPGVIVIVQFPDAGKPLKLMVPVGTEQVGCTAELIVGADGVTGCALIAMFVDADEVHPASFVTVTV